MKDMNPKKRLVVVLGMHRSGTSAITRSLEALGVSLGSHLMPPVEGNNAKGFFEDIDINAINIEMLNAVGSNWFFVSAISKQQKEQLFEQGFFLRAVELLREKFEHTDIFAFKDPRVAKLLPFWRDIFSHLGIEVSYVLALRNPLSVAQSLSKRDGFLSTHSHWLWLSHVLESLHGSVDKPRLIVNFDNLIQSPRKELLRIAEICQLEIDDDKLKIYEESFLDHSLRHTIYADNDLMLDISCPQLVQDVYIRLASIASGESSLEEPHFENELANWILNFSSQKTTLKLIDIQSEKISDLSATIKNNDALISNFNEHVTGLNSLLSERDLHISELSSTVLEKDAHIMGLNSTIAERDVHIEELNSTIAERDVHIEELNSLVIEREKLITELNELIDLNKSDLSSYNNILSIKDDIIANLIKEKNECVSEIERLNKVIIFSEHKNSQILTSASWRLTSPMRVISNQLRRVKHRILLLKSSSNNYDILGENPSATFNSNSNTLGNRESNLDIDDFDPVFYLNMYPDIAAGGGDPRQHYILHGRKEGRIGRIPEAEVIGSIHTEFDKSRDTILVVSHEASCTGAPILSLNLVKHFKERYNVLVLLLGGGTLINNFRELGAVVIVHNEMRNNQTIASIIIDKIVKDCNFNFAIVNSIESRIVLPFLAKHYIPTISLLHEFAAYTRPVNAFGDAFLWAGEVVFSTRLTLCNAIEQNPEFSGKFFHILPQGRCIMDSKGEDRSKKIADQKLLFDAMRPAMYKEKPFIVMGMGTVQQRKGVDLFIQCASKILSEKSSRIVHFIWIGHGYNPDYDVNYSVYLADQIERSGLKNHIRFIDETSEIDFAYREADILLLTSRLDPLPNVAIDALSEGLPVLCFNKASGIADILIDRGMQNECVADYLDISMLANKALRLINDDDFYTDVSRKSKEIAATTFDMSSYVNELINLAHMSRTQSEQEKIDVADILSSKLVDVDFYSRSAHVERDIVTVVRGYVRSWASGIGMRKVLPGFQPHLYKALNGGDNLSEDPFASFIRAGCPKGPWLYPVIKNTDKLIPISGQPRVALHLHVYYPELLSVMIDRLQVNSIKPDLFISVTSNRAAKEVEIQLARYKGTIVAIEVVPNRGRDIGPFFTAFGARIANNYDFIGHLHTKKTADIKDSSIGEVWFEFLLDNLLGTQDVAMMDRILGVMSSNPNIGMVYPDDPNVIGWGKNKPYVSDIANRLDIKDIPENIVFPIGTMFWAKVPALTPLWNLSLNWDEYPEEPLPYDGSVLHAIERLLPLALAPEFNQCVLTNVQGVTR
ncbi:rhamnan synthesis F family protein [Aeromonas caviae]